MPTEQEIELKTFITKQTFELLQKHFAKQLTHVSQTNHYYDSVDGILHAHKQALRLRQTKQKSVVTLKTKVDALTSQELTVPFEKDLHTTILQNQPLQNALPCAADQLNQIASFTTTRSFATLPFGTLFLDFTQFANNCFDYELEIELLSADDLHLAEEWLSQFAIDYEVAPPKIARAIAAQ